MFDHVPISVHVPVCPDEERGGRADRPQQRAQSNGEAQGAGGQDG